jgi:RNA polymerase sigma-70 factor, ECF subfamily
MAIAPPSFREVYDAHFAFVWRSLRRLGVPEADLPDAAQDVFLVVHRRLPEFEGRSKMSTWVFGIAMRVAQSRRKLAHVRREVVTDVPNIEERYDEASAGIAERAAMSQLLDQALGETPLEQRIVFVLFELEELSGEEIAELLAVPVGTVRSRLRLARSSVRRSVERRSRRDGLGAREVGS